jgi:hypothetical protein
MSVDFEKCADDLAQAAFGDRERLLAVAKPFTKAAETDWAAMLKDPTVQRYLLGGLGGAGLGALVGSLQSRNKKRNALMYGLMGGAGGLGLAHLAGGLGGPAAEKTISEMSVPELKQKAEALGITPQELLKRDLAESQSWGTFGKNVASGVGGSDLADTAAGGAAGFATGRGAGGLLEFIKNRLGFAPKPQRGLLPNNPKLRNTLMTTQTARQEAINRGNAASEANVKRHETLSKQHADQRLLDAHRHHGGKPLPLEITDAAGRKVPNPLAIDGANQDYRRNMQVLNDLTDSTGRGIKAETAAATAGIKNTGIQRARNTNFATRNMPSSFRRVKSPILRLALPAATTAYGLFNGIKKPLFGTQQQQQ